ncbi:maleylpyruvate isomerase N-terminal domain-containing protein [Streptomyces sp. NPDC060194]|uniref:maleylpyruvate isomerase N-terminal domain-containing protein n=1 Tax=Streptomyces sp. NPDC060194 TaxID=3347069 RepID=UPI00364D936D
MDGVGVPAALRAESARLYDMLSGLPEAEWDRPTRCGPWAVPWSVRELVAHVTEVLGEAPAPPPAQIAVTRGQVLADGFDRAWRTVDPPSRTPSWLTARLLTVTVHGFDLAEALGHPPWTTAEAAAATEALLEGGRLTGVRRTRGVPPQPVRLPDPERTAYLRRATGRLPLDEAERAVAATRGRFPLSPRWCPCPDLSGDRPETAGTPAARQR